MPDAYNDGENLRLLCAACHVVAHKPRRPAVNPLLVSHPEGGSMAGTIYGERRRALGLTAASVAAQLGVHHDLYSRWERGRESMPPARAKQLDRLLLEYERARERVSRRAVP